MLSHTANRYSQQNKSGQGRGIIWDKCIYLCAQWFQIYFMTYAFFYCILCCFRYSLALRKAFYHQYITSCNTLFFFFLYDFHSWCKSSYKHCGYIYPSPDRAPLSDSLQTMVCFQDSENCAESRGCFQMIRHQTVCQHHFQKAIFLFFPLSALTFFLPSQVFI